MASKKAVKLHCSGCGRKSTYPRAADPDLPANVVRIVSSVCDRCDNGDFGSETWFDADDREVHSPDAA